LNGSNSSPEIRDQISTALDMVQVRQTSLQPPQDLLARVIRKNKEDKKGKKRKPSGAESLPSKRETNADSKIFYVTYCWSTSIECIF
jgi:hypothetical protein